MGISVMNSFPALSKPAWLVDPLSILIWKRYIEASNGFPFANTTPISVPDFFSQTWKDH